MAAVLRSKTGCLKCRRRRIKCDEAHPICYRCQKGGLECIWPGRAHVNTQYLESNTTIGNLYASLFLQNEIVNFNPRLVEGANMLCPARSISSGYPPLRHEGEHRSLLKLGAFLSMLTFNQRPDHSFEFTIALQELWVRDALLATANFIGGGRDKSEVWTAAYPYYSSATKAVRRYLAEDLDEARMEQLLVASQFLGIIDITNPHNEIFPLLHFEAVGRLLEALHAKQAGKVLPSSQRRFHRIALESYLYHVSIQSLFWPQTERFATLSSIHETDDQSIDVSPEANIICKMDLTIYIILFKLNRLARLKSLNPQQTAQARQLNRQIVSIEAKTLALDGAPIDTATNVSREDYVKWTLLATGTLAILSAKVIDRSLRSTSLAIRPLVEMTLHRLEDRKPVRAYTGDSTWIFTILACAVSTKVECERLSAKVKQFSNGFWGSDLDRMKKVLEVVRRKRVAISQSRVDEAGNFVATDTLNLLVEAKLALA